MKILIVSNFLPPMAGGAEQVALEMAKRLSQIKGLKVHILTTGKEGTKIKEGLIVHKVLNLLGKEIYYSTLGFNKIKRIIDENNFDLIHVHIVLPWGYILRNFKAKKVITCHGSDVFPKKLIKSYFVNSALKKADAITSPSKWLSNCVLDNYSFKSKTIGNGIDTKKFKPLKNIKQKKDVILFVGRYIERKGINELLSVAKELPKYEFWFVGKGPLENEISGKNIKNLGIKNSKQIAILYSKANICVFPSYWENMPMVGLEALSCGKAIIATKLGFSEIIKNGREGLIIKPKNKKELKNAIIKLMENSKLKKKFEKNARKKALKYDWDKIVKEYYLLYKQLIQR